MNSHSRQGKPTPMPRTLRALRLASSVAAGIMLAHLLSPPHPAFAASFVVNTTDNTDDGVCDGAHCSLREAIAAANASPGPDTISFDIAGSGPHVIGLGPLSPLPSLTDDGTVIDGTSEPDYAGAPVIVVQPWIGAPPSAPPAVPLPAEGLWLEASDTTIRGLSVVGFGPPAMGAGAGIVVNSGSGNVIELNYVGLDVSGSPVGNGTGIRLGPPGQTVRQNMISGDGIGVEIHSGNHVVQANWIGLDPTGTSAVPNEDGIRVEGFFPPTTGLGGSLVIGGSGAGEGNVISGNTRAGVLVSNASTGITILGNRIGTNAAGLSAVANEMGIILENATGVVIGGTGPADGNLISGNLIHGIWVKSWVGSDSTVTVPSDYAQILGNTVGLAADGSALPNGTEGIFVNGSHHVIGGDAPGAGNVVSANGDSGIRLQGGEDVTISGNWVGTDSTGTLAVGNGAGIRVQSDSVVIADNTIEHNEHYAILFKGSSDSLARENVIRLNGDEGITMSDVSIGTRDTFSRNQIYDNGLLGIDLRPEGVNPNDPGDLDGGPNDGLNYPVFTAISLTDIEGTACPGCVVELFIADDDPSDYGEGRTHLGTVAALEDGTWSAPLTGVGFCTPVTATATDLIGNTSEFSRNARPACALVNPFGIGLFLVGAAIVGAAVGGARATRLGRPVLPHAVGGTAAGAVVAVALSGAALALPFVELGEIAPPPAPPPAGTPSCLTYLDEDSLSPANGAVFEPNDEPVFGWNTMDLPGLNVRWVIEVQGPDGAARNQVAASPALPLGTFGFDPAVPGRYRWTIRGEQAEAGSDLWMPFCTSDSALSFRIGAPAAAAAGPPPWTREPAAPVPPTLTPTPTSSLEPVCTPPPCAPGQTLTCPSGICQGGCGFVCSGAGTTVAPQPPTATFTAHPPTRTATTTADTSGPSINSISDSPDPIKVTQPKGCSPNTSTVSAAISDPSGVASAYVLFFHTTIGQVSMTHGGGNTWTATLGPYTGTGDGTVDYQIHAVDSLGNATDSAFRQITVLACLP